MPALRGKSLILCPLLLFFNLIFLIFGIGIIVGGFLVLFIFQNYDDVIGNTGKAVFIILITVGFVIIFVALLGCCGTFRLDPAVLRAYMFFMVLIIILELAAGITGYVLRDEFDKLIDDNMKQLQRDYNSSTPSRDIIDSMQQDLKCCGVHYYTDWIGWDADQPEILPESCCKIPDTPGCSMIDSATFDIYTYPCSLALKDLLLNNMGIITGIAIGIACIQISAVVSSWRMRKIMMTTKLEFP